MNQKDIINMAHEASPDMTWYAAIDDPTTASPQELNFLKRFAALVAAAEREACAKFFDDNDTNMFWGSQAAQHIRARGETK